MRTIEGKPATVQQIRALHVVFRNAGMGEENRRNFLAHLTNGRTTSTKELTMEEARDILNGFKMKQQVHVKNEAKQVCKHIYALSFQISFLNKGFDTSSCEEFEMNKAKINQFCRERTRIRKNLTEMTLSELKQVKKQMEAIARKENEDTK